MNTVNFKSVCSVFKMTVFRVHETQIGIEKGSKRDKLTEKIQLSFDCIITEHLRLIIRVLEYLWVMLDIPSQYMHYFLVLLCEIYCVIV